MKQIILSIFLLFSSASFAEEDEWWQYYDRTKIIHLQFSDKVLNDYTVNVAWNPDGGLAPILTGSALINFNSNKEFVSESFSVRAEYFHIPGSMLKDAGFVLFNEDGEFNLSVDLSKTYQIKSDFLKKMSLWSNRHKYDVSSSWEQTPFFFEDIDFDGVDELIITSFNSGQRGDNEYAIHKLHNRWEHLAYKEINTAPFDFIDQHTTFDNKNKTITKFYSGGACANLEDTYKLIDSEFKYIEHIEWDYSYTTTTEYESICTELTYDIVDNKKVIKSKSESYWDNNKSEWIDLGVKFY